MMDSIFWTRNIDPSQPALMLVDGHPVESGDASVRDLVMLKMGEVRQWTCVPAVSQMRGYGKRFNKSFNLAIKPGCGITVLSSLLPDSSGCSLPFLFYTRCEDLDLALEQLRNCADVLGLGLDHEELRDAAKVVAENPTLESDSRPSSLKSLNGGYGKIWYHIQRH